MKNCFYGVLDAKKERVKMAEKENKNQVIAELTRVRLALSGSSTHAVAVVKQGNPLFNKRPTTRVEDPETSSGITLFDKRQTARGFTLIESLVVVLIIGILAAVALPQYQVAVAKSRFANLYAVASMYKRAAEVAKLNTGNWPRTFDELDIDSPGGSVLSAGNIADDTCAANAQMYCCLHGRVYGQQTAGLTCALTDYTLAYYWDETNKQNVCFGKSNTPADTFCKTLGGTNTNSSGNNLIIPNGNKSGYNRYNFNPY